MAVACDLKQKIVVLILLSFSGASCEETIPGNGILFGLVSKRMTAGTERWFLPVVGAESDMDLDLLAESESDSESEHSRDQDNVSVQRSAITTAATAGSEAGLAYFSEDDSGDSSNQDEEESDAEGSEEHDDTDDIGKFIFIFHEET